MAISFTNSLLDLSCCAQISQNGDIRLRLSSKKSLMPIGYAKISGKFAHRAEKKYEPIIAAIDSQSAGEKFSEVPAVVVLKAEVVIKRKGSPSLGEVFMGGTNPIEAVNDVISSGIDTFSDAFCQRIYLQLVSTEIDQATGKGKRNQESAFGNWLQKTFSQQAEAGDRVKYVTQLIVDEKFGKPGAVVVVNKHQREIFLESITVEGMESGTVYFPCYSWVKPQKDDASKRVFFTNEVYLSSATPRGLVDLRRNEMKALQGNGQGVRVAGDRIYDYDIYNDLGKPDESDDLRRPNIGGSKERPYPRRCRTGHPPSQKDPQAESRIPLNQNIYVPRDEEFQQVKADGFLPGRLKAILNGLAPALISHFKKEEEPDTFHSFDEIDKLYYDGLQVKVTPELMGKETFWDKLYTSKLVKPVKGFSSNSVHLVKYPLPEILHRDKFGWMFDFAFGRQFLAGVNPSKIERLKVYPPAGSAFSAEHVTPFLDGLTIEKAIEEEKLFIVDYHDIFLPFIDKINALEGRKAYATRTIFLKSSGVIKPIAIELSLPSSGSSASESCSRVITPAVDATGAWLWQLAKAHVSSNHMGYHQLVTHWLHTHACSEPYVIATHRQLSALHPVSRLLQPHLRYTMEINASARQSLICADGVIEQCFTPGKYALEMSSVAYGIGWRFDHESLPADLIRRGMAVADKKAPHGLRLVIEDYPYAVDGLLIWSAINSWVKEYLSIYYSHPNAISTDSELQQWWTEIRTKGHADKADEPWWPKLQSADDLTQILTTIIWVVSGQHAAVNFGQFLYAGYVPYLPCTTRQLIPDEHQQPEAFNRLVSNPQRFFLETIPSKFQTTTVMAVLETLSTHSQDEEYLGKRNDPNWTQNQAVREAEARFAAQLDAIEATIHEKNRDPRFKNRYGAGITPYQLLVPSSGPGVTGKGIPNSISI